MVWRLQLSPEFWVPVQVVDRVQVDKSGLHPLLGLLDLRQGVLFSLETQESNDTEVSVANSEDSHGCIQLLSRL